jgi:hypothetical protein
MKFRFVIILGILFSLILAGCATSNTKTDVEKNLDSVKLAAGDFPEGFKELSDSQVKQRGITPEGLAKAFEVFFIVAKPINLTVFTNPGDTNGALVFALIFYPLSMGDIRGWDGQVKDPNKIAQDIASGGGQGTLVIPKPEYSGLGDSSIGFSIIYTDNSKVDFIHFRRNTTASLILIKYTDNLPVDIAQLAGKLDERIIAAYMKINN